ncbi:hypothetical protein [Sphingosinicella sp. CPCC 101087]|uniref:hypothetical protein n=1 Tax=Sphingosinicella sp. CPCC 101087 TaxID=2497754 RepID=UPI00101D8921|nr:hypothetical protein [Sphingosinicella sp. CPCC 101087]
MSDPLLQQEVLATLLRETNLTFWQVLTQRKRWAYSEAFAAVDNDPRPLPNQKKAKLLDERFYLCERALHDAAVEAGAVSSDQKIAVNNWIYTVARVGAISIIQTYVQSPEDFARPAKFREQHAGLNDFLRRPQFALGDVSPAIFEISKVAGIIIHGPRGRPFTEALQRLEFLNFCVPSEDYKRWEVNLPVPEIVAAFNAAPAAQPQRDIATPKPRDRDQDKKDRKESA